MNIITYNQKGEIYSIQLNPIEYYAFPKQYHFIPLYTSVFNSMPLNQMTMKFPYWILDTIWNGTKQNFIFNLVGGNVI